MIWQKSRISQGYKISFNFKYKAWSPHQLITNFSQNCHPRILWDKGNYQSQKRTNLYLPLTLTSRVHWTFPSGKGIDLGKRSGNSNSPKVVKGEGRCRFSGAIRTQSCLSTWNGIQTVSVGQIENQGANHQAYSQIFMCSSLDSISTLN